MNSVASVVSLLVRHLLFPLPQLITISPIGAPYRRSLDSVLGTSHLSNQTGLEAESDPFDGAGSCTLVPEATQGPYWVDGEYVRKDIHEDQAGLYTYVDLELIDYTTCETIAADIFVDIWHCNATGVYSGVVASGNGDSGVGENLVSEGWYSVENKLCLFE